MKIHLLQYCLLLFLGTISAQDQDINAAIEVGKWEILPLPVNENFRGLSVTKEGIIWLSGTNSTVLKSEDFGENWSVFHPDTFRVDYRDIEAISKNEAYVMSSGTPAVIHYTADGGVTWENQFYSADTLVFLDGMAFGKGQGYVYGDPIEGQMFLMTSSNNKWQMVTDAPNLIEGEYGFAASGSGIQALGDLLHIVSGGKQSALYTRCNEQWKSVQIPVRSGPSEGVFSMHFMNELEGIVVGGSYVDSVSVQGNCAVSVDGGVTWKQIEENPPLGYRSCIVCDNSGAICIATGRTGTDISIDKGMTWQEHSREAFYVVTQFNGMFYGAGKNGRFGHLKIEK